MIVEQDGDKVIIATDAPPQWPKVIELFYQLRHDGLTYNEALQLLYLDMIDKVPHGVFEPPRIGGR